MSTTHDPFPSNRDGYIELDHSPYGGICTGMYSGRGPEHIRQHHDADAAPEETPVVTNVRRARQVAVEFHGWPA